jgi:hypothetical protein
MALAAAVLLVGGLSAKATITLTLQDATSKAETGFVSTSDVGATLANNELIGIYRFNSSGDTGPQNPFWSTCLSPVGNLDYGTYNYAQDTFLAGAPGHNPPAWAIGTQGDAGIQNAQYLWRLFSPTVIASGGAAQGAGLSLAMDTALYDSTAYGTYNAGSAHFQVTSGLSGAVLTAYNTYLAALSPAAVSANQGNGYILRNTVNAGAGQDLIWNVTPVPEPTTMIAGALLLLPFGASTLRVLRKNRTA